MLAIVVFYEIWQMDIKTTFLNGFIKEELYMILLPLEHLHWFSLEEERVMQQTSIDFS